MSIAVRKIRHRHRLDQRHRPGNRREARRRRDAACMLNGFGDPSAIEEIRSRLAEQNHVDVHYHEADLTRPDEIHELGRVREGCLRRRGYPGEQRRRPACRPDRGVSRRSLGLPARPEPLGGLPLHARGAPRDARARTGVGSSTSPRPTAWSRRSTRRRTSPRSTASWA